VRIRRGPSALAPFLAQARMDEMQVNGKRVLLAGAPTNVAQVGLWGTGCQLCVAPRPIPPMIVKSCGVVKTFWCGGTTKPS